jgi:two-component system, response regulator
LLVEDNPNDEMLTLRALKKANLANPVHVVRDGAEALDYLFARGDFAHREGEELPSVVLLDLKLPKVSGLEVLQQIRAEKSTERVPVVILTSSDEQRDIISSYELGANSYVRKPVSFDEFTKAVTQLGLYWLLLNHAPPDES